MMPKLILKYIFKKKLIFKWNASDIFLRMNPIIFKMIIRIINGKLIPYKQKGKVVNFTRRKPKEGNINRLSELSKGDDFIRMLDCEGYPNAFSRIKIFKIRDV